MLDDKTQSKQSSISEAFAHKSYLVRKKFFKIFGAAFHIYDPSGKVVFYSKMKALKLKEDIRLYTGEDMQTEILSIQARQIIDFYAAYDVIDTTTGTKVGALKRKGFKSMLKDEWIIMDTEDREIGFIKEDSMLLALIRRVLAYSFYYSDFSFPNLIPQKYYGELNGEQVCLFKQNFNPLVMKINLDFSMDKKGLLDRRLGIAGAVLLCAIEGKQL